MFTGFVRLLMTVGRAIQQEPRLPGKAYWAGSRSDLAAALPLSAVAARSVGRFSRKERRLT
jgi:hypothetical protein